jgi:predicted transcriptional regulator
MRTGSSPSLLARLNFGRALGPLEARVMEVVWRHGPCTVRDVLTAFSEASQPEVAYTTAMTVMGNLVEKGLLICHAAGRSYIYTAAVTRDAFVRAQVKAVLDTLLDGFTAPTLSYFAERLSTGEPAQLSELERLIAAERARLAEKDDSL